jgi:hypothetical protein
MISYDAIRDAHLVNRSTLCRFAKYVFAEPNTGCHLWAGAISDTGYGKFWLEGKGPSVFVGAHQFALGVSLGRFPRLFTLHSCDVRACVNPDHLREGTQLENLGDATSRGRIKSLLSRGDVVEIKKRLASGERHAAIASDYEICTAAVNHINTGRNWRHV